MNILIKADKENVEKYIVTLTSLFVNHKEKINVYCVEDKSEAGVENELDQIIKKYDGRIVFFKKDDIDIINVNCNEIMMAHLFLPQDLDRVLYLSSDVIINGNINSFYESTFDNQYMLVRGQTYKAIRGEYHKIGARPEKGQCFDSRVLLLNLSKMRVDFNLADALNSVQQKNLGDNFTTQGLLNVVFERDVKYENDFRYNGRKSIFEDSIKCKGHIRAEDFRIICFERRDYYNIGILTTPWELVLEEEEISSLKDAGVIKERYFYKEEYSADCQIIEMWWRYARLTSVYDVLLERMTERKRQILGSIHRTDQQVEEYKKKKNILVRLCENIDTVDVKDLQEIRYKELEQFIDSVSRDDAIKTMRNLFAVNCSELAKKQRIRIGFVVYSSAEWQCEDLYRLLEKDERFAPSIVIAYYSQGDRRIKQDTYEKTCHHFENGNYDIIYSGSMDNTEDNVSKFNILVYFTSFYLHPNYINILNRNVTQLCIHIPYAYYLVNKEDAIYQQEYYEKPIFKLTWFYFSECRSQQVIASRSQRLEGYNICTSGMPKLDTLIHKTYVNRKYLWKCNSLTGLKLIWAPHFNLANGMNGTFHENYVWLYEYARLHQDISWIVRPHPRMEIGVLEAGIFKSKDEYRQYIEQWNALPNATVVEGGEYYDIFDSSDAMILDSVSFLAEYQFTGKPLLLLCPKVPRSMNGFGEQLVSVLYQARGNAFLEIEKFIDNCKRGVDSRKRERGDFFEKYLDYEKLNKKQATDFIYETIVTEIFG